MASLRPTEEFGPRNPSDKERWKLFKRGIIANGGGGPDIYQLPPGETPSNNNLPSWLTVLADGSVVPRKEVMNNPDMFPQRRVENKEQDLRSFTKSGETDFDDEDFANVEIDRK